MSVGKSNKKVVVIGAGMSGSLMSMYLAQRGYEVDLYELRGDMRTEPVAPGRSINLTLAARALRALREVDCLETILECTIPLRGRMVHAPDGSRKFQAYGKNEHEVIYSIRRNELNQRLLDLAESYPNTRLHFKKKCLELNRDEGRVLMRDEVTQETFMVEGDFIIGTDGAFSVIRQQMQRGQRASYEQDFLDWGFKELVVPPGPGGSYQMENHTLHVWPRGDCMFMGMPNRDGSFACTTSLPFEGELSLERLQTKEEVMRYFESRFPDVVPLVPDLAEQFIRHPAVEMITTRTLPWYYKNRVVLIGDACHAVVPWYGQGMNAAFEDCSILNACLEQNGDDREQAFKQYQSLRKRNTDALADLSKQNFLELRDKTKSRIFVARKNVDVTLNRVFPHAWVPLYTHITHSTIPYKDAVERDNRRKKVMKYVGIEAVLMTVAGLIVVAGYLKKPLTAPRKNPEGRARRLLAALENQYRRGSAFVNAFLGRAGKQEAAATAPLADEKKAPRRADAKRGARTVEGS